MEKYCKKCGAVFNDLKFKLCPYCGGELDTRYGRQPIPRKLRHEVFMRDGYRCRECGASKDETSLEIDHIVPVARGGTNDIDNLQTLCRECNRMKHTDTWVGGETNLESLEKQLSQLNELLNGKKSLLNQATTEKEEITIKYDIIKLNEKIQDVEEQIKSEEKKIEDNIIKKKEAEINDFTFKWLYSSVPEEKMSLLCDLLMIKNHDQMDIITLCFVSDIYKNVGESYQWYESYDEKFDYLTYFIFNPFKEYYECINYIMDICFEKNHLTMIDSEMLNDFENNNLEKYLNGIFTFNFWNYFEESIYIKHALNKGDKKIIETMGYDSMYINAKPKEKYMQYLAKYFSLDELKQTLNELDDKISKFNNLDVNLKDIFHYNSADNLNNSKLRILYRELNISGYHLPLQKIKHIVEGYSGEEIISMVNNINYIIDISENPIKIGIENENMLKLLLKELNVDESFSPYLKFKLLFDNYSKNEINSIISYIKDILDIIYSEVENNPDLDNSLINNDKYIYKQFKSISDEILEFTSIKRKLLEVDCDDNFLSLFFDYENHKSSDIVNYILMNYSIEDINKIINLN